MAAPCFLCLLQQLCHEEESAGMQCEGQCLPASSRGSRDIRVTLLSRWSNSCLTSAPLVWGDVCGDDPGRTVGVRRLSANTVSFSGRHLSTAVCSSGRPATNHTLAGCKGTSVFISKMFIHTYR